jgi:hypothetical protein
MRVSWHTSTKRHPAELVERLSGEIEPSDFKLLVSSPRLMAVFRDVMAARGVSVRLGRGVRIRDAMVEVCMKTKYLLKSKLMLWIVRRPESPLPPEIPTLPPVAAVTTTLKEVTPRAGSVRRKPRDRNKYRRGSQRR